MVMQMNRLPFSMLAVSVVRTSRRMRSFDTCSTWCEVSVGLTQFSPDESTHGGSIAYHPVAKLPRKLVRRFRLVRNFPMIHAATLRCQFAVCTEPTAFFLQFAEQTLRCHHSAVRILANLLVLSRHLRRPNNRSILATMHRTYSMDRWMFVD